MRQAAESAHAAGSIAGFGLNDSHRVKSHSLLHVFSISRSRVDSCGSIQNGSVLRVRFCRKSWSERLQGRAPDCPGTLYPSQASHQSMYRHLLHTRSELKFRIIVARRQADRLHDQRLRCRAPVDYEKTGMLLDPQRSKRATETCTTPNRRATANPLTLMANQLRACTPTVP